MEIHKGSQEDFLQWLERYEDEEFIGHADDPSDCPLQHYLKSINPTLVVFVGTKVILWNGSLHMSEALEPWQIVVVKITDRIAGAITKKDFIESFSKGKKDGNK